MKALKLGSRFIGRKQKCYIIAEAGVNHNGQLAMALELVREAKKAGADCVKFQTFKAERIITKKAPKAQYQLQVTDPKESQFEMLKKLELQPEDYYHIISLCKRLRIDFLSTPYNQEDANFLNDLGVEAFKIASGQLVELPFLQYVAKFKKPTLLSTGMATLSEVYEGVEAIREAGNDQIILLQCTTNYPSKIDDANLRAMVTMGQALDVAIGYSDHVENNYACFAAVALGAQVVEKHFTLERNLPGPDHPSSLDPVRFAELVYGIRQIEKALGKAVKRPTYAEMKNMQGMRRSLVALKPIARGDVIKAENIGFKRPATGIAPKMFSTIVGKRAAKDIPEDLPLTNDMIEW